MNARTLGIMGVGLIGGSIGLRAREIGLYVNGYDADENAAQRAVALGALDAVVGREDLYARSEIVVLSLPVRATIDELERLAALQREPALPQTLRLVIDVASVKAPIVEAAAEVPCFVATHPMAGNEGSGVEAADAQLFEGRTWAYVPGADSPTAPKGQTLALELITALGARPVAVQAQEHDAIVALTSHMPQMFAWALAQRVRAAGETHSAQTVDALCGPVARELLRIGRTHPAMWDDVLSCNAQNLASELEAMASELRNAAASLLHDAEKR